MYIHCSCTNSHVREPKLPCAVPKPSHLCWSQDSENKQGLHKNENTLQDSRLLSQQAELSRKGREMRKPSAAAESHPGSSQSAISGCMVVNGTVRGSVVCKTLSKPPKMCGERQIGVVQSYGSFYTVHTVYSLDPARITVNT